MIAAHTSEQAEQVKAALLQVRQTGRRLAHGKGGFLCLMARIGGVGNMAVVTRQESASVSPPVTVHTLIIGDEMTADGVAESLRAIATSPIEGLIFAAGLDDDR